MICILVQNWFIKLKLCSGLATINNVKIDDLSQRMYDEITAIQSGEKKDKFNWNYHIY
ncbi:MAG: hypothetical protein H7263_01630 [Candidatus Sericytochromatia bacterium]|nr:hypothetical protein [Candidatus Sericytochromatia bacterium]